MVEPLSIGIIDNEAVTARNTSLMTNPEGPLRAMHIAVNIGFAALLLLSTFRYFSNHPFEGKGISVAVLAIGTGLAYAIAVIGPRSSTRHTIGILSATALWLPLALIAPSFSWCSFALIFAVHQVLPRVSALLMSAVIVCAVGGGLFWMSGGTDPAVLLGPFVGGIVIVTTYIALNRALENTRRLTEELRATSAQLAAAERKAGVQAERSRFASELHDTVVQRTVSALLLLEAASPDDTTNEEARRVLRESLVETRQLLHGMKPQPTHTSLGVALAEAADVPNAELTVHGDVIDLDDDTSHALIRVATEALINATKYAAAAHHRVTLTYFPTEVGIDIADDGNGFDVAAIRATDRGFGLRAMQWRIENLGGTFSIESAPGQGTVVAAIVPITHTLEAQ